MSVDAKCPKCATTSSVPPEMVGKKVRCKKCQNQFVIQASAGGKTSPRPSSKSNLSSSGALRRKQKSNAGIMWIIASLVLVCAVGGGAAYYHFVIDQSVDPPRQAKNNRKDRGTTDKDKSEKKGGVGEPSKVDVTKKTPPIVDLSETPKSKPETPKTPNPKTKGNVKEETFTPELLTKLTLAMPVELAALTDVQELFPFANKSHLVGLRSREKDQNYFEVYDLKKHERLGKFKIPDNTQLLDVDPDGTRLAISDSDRHFQVYSLPDGSSLEDDWRPYDNNKDEMRFGAAIVGFQLISPTQLWVMTNRGQGDLWDWSKQKVEYLIPASSREDYRKAEVVGGRDFILSPDRTMFAFASDEGIGFFDAKTKNKIGSTGKLTKYGHKPDLMGLGFDPSGKVLAAYFSASKQKGRSYFHARFSVPEGEEKLLEEIADPVFWNIEFVNNEYFLSFDRRMANLRDDKGKTVATCGFPGRFGLFAPHVHGGKVAFAYNMAHGGREKPHVGVVDVPLVKAQVPMKVDTTKSLEELLIGTNPAKKASQRAFEREEIWEFGGQGIMKRGVRTFEVK